MPGEGSAKCRNNFKEGMVNYPKMPRSQLNVD